jgi:hypothetical protein
LTFTLFISLIPILQLHHISENPNICVAVQRMAAIQGESIMSTVTVTGVANVPTPRGAVWAARGAAAAWAALSCWLASSGSSRVLSSAQTGAAREAAMVRAMARHHAATDPGFAADLMAAADCHEAAAAPR